MALNRPSWRARVRACTSRKKIPGRKVHVNRTDSRTTGAHTGATWLTTRPPATCHSRWRTARSRRDRYRSTRNHRWKNVPVFRALTSAQASGTICHDTHLQVRPDNVLDVLTEYFQRYALNDQVVDEKESQSYESLWPFLSWEAGKKKKRCPEITKIQWIQFLRQFFARFREVHSRFEMARRNVDPRCSISHNSTTMIGENTRNACDQAATGSACARTTSDGDGL